MKNEFKNDNSMRALLYMNPKPEWQLFFGFFILDNIMFYFCLMSKKIYGWIWAKTRPPFVKSIDTPHLLGTNPNPEGIQRE